jgi:hypothetical protein
MVKPFEDLISGAIVEIRGALTPTTAASKAESAVLTTWLIGTQFA